MCRKPLIIATVAIAFAVPAYSECPQEAERSHYTLQRITFEAAQAFPAEQLRALIPLADGRTFSVAKIRNGLQAIMKLYGEHGYIEFTSIPSTNCDDEHKTVSLQFVLDEGAQFRFTKLRILAPKGVAERLFSSWPMKPGAVYNTTLLGNFLLENRALWPVGWTAAHDLIITPDEKTKSVQVRLNVCTSDEVCPQASREF